MARRALGNDGGWVFGADAGAATSKSRTSPSIGSPETGIRVSARTTCAARSFHCRRGRGHLGDRAEMLVNHAIGGDVTSGYFQITVDRLRDPAQNVGDRLKELCGVEQPAGVAKLDAAQ